MKYPYSLPGMLFTFSNNVDVYTKDIHQHDISNFKTSFMEKCISYTIRNGDKFAIFAQHYHYVQYSTMGMYAWGGHRAI